MEESRQMLMKFVQDFTEIAQKIKASVDKLITTFDRLDTNINKTLQVSEITMDISKKNDHNLTEEREDIKEAIGLLQSVIRVLTSDKDGIRVTIKDLIDQLQNNTPVEVAKIQSRYNLWAGIIIAVTNIITGVVVYFLMGSVPTP